MAVFADGSSYKGSFVRNIMDGHGVYNWAKGHEYKGSFRDGQMEGEGTFTNKNGTVMSGKFKRNQFDSVSMLILFDFFTKWCFPVGERQSVHQSS